MIPSLRAIPFEQSPNKSFVKLLSQPQKLQLAGIATREQLPSRAIVYRADSAARSVFIIDQGMVKAYRDFPSGRRRILAFHVDEDIFGLAEAGRYVNTLQTVMPTTLYRLPIDRLMDMLHRDPVLDVHFLCKVTHELRKSHRHAIVMGRRDAPGRVAMFMQMLEEQLPTTPDGDIDIPMTRSDIANYLGLSLESVVRACAKLEKSGIVKFVNRHNARVLDGVRFHKLITAM